MHIGKHKQPSINAFSSSISSTSGSNSGSSNNTCNSSIGDSSSRSSSGSSSTKVTNDNQKAKAFTLLFDNSRNTMTSALIIVSN